MVTVTPLRVGRATITVTAQDSGGLSATQTIAVTVVAANRAPTAVGTLAAVTLTVGGSTTTRGVASYFSDPENDSLTFTASSSASAVATADVSGSVVTVTPVAVGSATITVTAQDPDGLSATQTIAVEVVNQAPAAVGTLAALTFHVGDYAATREVVSYFSDPENDSLTFTASSSDAAVATADVSGSVVTVTPVAVGSATITVTAQDSDGLSATQAIAVEVVNQAPVAVGAIAAVTVTFGDSVATREVAPYFIDPENDALTFTASSSDEAVATASVSGSVVTVTPVAGGSATITVTAQDPIGLNATQTIAVTVLASDLVISDFDVSDRLLARTFGLITQYATVSNQGTAAAAATTLRYQSSHSSNPTYPYEEGTDSVSSLAVSATSDATFGPVHVSRDSPEYFRVCVDSVSSESDTSNNCSSWIEVEKTGVPDVVVSDISVSASTVDPGASFTLNTTVHNQGIGLAISFGGTEVWYYYSTDSTISTDDAWAGPDINLPALAGSAAPSSVNTSSTNVGPSTTMVSQTLSAPVYAGTYYYYARVIAEGVFGEESNNYSALVPVTVPVSGRPDLTVDIGLSHSDETVTAGESFRLITFVNNIGLVTADATTVKYFWRRTTPSPTSYALVSTISVPSIEGSLPTENSPYYFISAGASSFFAGGAGTYFYKACVTSVPSETNTGNNCSDQIEQTIQN